MVKLGKKWLTKSPDELRYAARWAYLDGCTARAKALNSLADKMDRVTRKAVMKLVEQRKTEGRRPVEPFV